MKIELLHYSGHLGLTEAASIVHGKKVGCDDKTLKRLVETRHSALQKHTFITLKISGISRKAADQLIRHKNLEMLMSSTMYGNVKIPSHYDEILAQDCKYVVQAYNACSAKEKDDYSYRLPLSIPCDLLISGSVWELKHLIRQRHCSRNTPEVSKIASELAKVLFERDPIIFDLSDMVPYCCWNSPKFYCQERKSDVPCHEFGRY